MRLSSLLSCVDIVAITKVRGPYAEEAAMNGRQTLKVAFDCIFRQKSLVFLNSSSPLSSCPPKPFSCSSSFPFVGQDRLSLAPLLRRPLLEEIVRTKAIYNTVIVPTLRLWSSVTWRREGKAS